MSDLIDPARPERYRLTKATRRLIEAVRKMDPDVDLSQIAAQVEKLTSEVEKHQIEIGEQRGRGNYRRRSPLVGRSNAMAPPFTYEFDSDQVAVHGTFGLAYEGPPGFVHGGWISLAFDEIMGMANAIGGHVALTARLTVKYREPTPLEQPVRIEAHTKKVEGRRITTIGTLSVGEKVTAEAEGLFIALDEKRTKKHFG
ncbi:aromatic compound degradation protein PaaI [Actinomycetes bacterium]|nr:aromatic compound degradation protein PaaI [Actinomycetes bacterium]